jgi:hypothetical protein
MIAYLEGIMRSHLLPYKDFIRALAYKIELKCDPHLGALDENNPHSSSNTSNNLRKACVTIESVPNSPVAKIEHWNGPGMLEHVDNVEETTFKDGSDDELPGLIISIFTRL